MAHLVNFVKVALISVNKNKPYHIAQIVQIIAKLATYKDAIYVSLVIFYKIKVV